MMSSSSCKDVFQEADITGAVESLPRYSYIVKNVEDIPRVFKEAFYIANTGRRGPVLIDVPIDVQNAKFDFSYPESVSLRTYKPTVKGHIIQIKKVIAELSKAKMPLICVGGGVLLSEARDEVRAFAEKYQIPVVSTMMGISAMPTEHPLYFGMVGNNGKAYANRAMNECDLLIVMGARLADRAIQQLNMNALAEERTVVHIDVDPAEIGKIMGPTIPIVGDIRHIMNDFSKQTFENDFSDWLQLLNMWKKEMAPKRRPNPEYVDPAEFIRILSEKLDDDAIYVADVGQNQIWSAGYHIVKNGRFLTSGGMGTMGYSIPAAIGAKRADMNRQVIAVCGDGSFQMSFMELATMQQHHIPIKIVVLKNNFLGMVREYQHYTYHDRYSVVNLDRQPGSGEDRGSLRHPFCPSVQYGRCGREAGRFPGAGRPAAIMECVIDQYDLVK